MNPKRVRLCTYQVGFGDCFLLSFDYAREHRHVLVDFGTTGAPKSAPEDSMMRIAEDIRRRCDGKLHVVVATHRHKDHISGFATSADGNGPGDVIRSCSPEIVVQPWTEQLDLRPDVKAPRTSLTDEQAFVGSLASMHRVAELALDELARASEHFPKEMSDQIAFLGEDNLSNRSAIENLATMGRHEPLYLHYGADTSRLEHYLPGVIVKALGPPTLKQSKRIGTERTKDEAEFWHLQALSGSLATAAGHRLFPEAKVRDDQPPYARWFCERVRKARGEQLLAIVRALDKAMNNTSVILLFKAGKKRLLFPGDAQIENWLYALTEAEDREEVLSELAQVDVYKVGHHGSLNATPKTLWGGFEKKDDRDGARGRLRSFVSTMAGKHGSREAGTEVPRTKLMRALRHYSTCFSTEDLDPHELSKEFEIDLA